MKYVALTFALLAAIAVTGCSSANKPKANTSVTDIRSSTPPAPAPYVAPAPVQPAPVNVQPVVSDTPTTVASAATPTITGNTYTVQKGDTLFKIARAKYNDPAAVKKIKEANPGLDADHIKAGQKINLP